MKLLLIKLACYQLTDHNDIRFLLYETYKTLILRFLQEKTLNFMDPSPHDTQFWYTTSNYKEEVNNYIIHCWLCSCAYNSDRVSIYDLHYKYSDNSLKHDCSPGFCLYCLRYM
jgi:hypothetical protein